MLISFLLHCLETHIKTLDRVCECTNGNEIHTAHGIIVNRINRDASGGLDFHMPSGGLFPCTDMLNRLLRAFRREVIQHDAVRDIRRQCLVYLRRITHFDLDTQVLAFLLTIVACTRERIRDATRKVHVIVLEQYHVKQPNTMVHTTSDGNSLFLEVTQTRSRFAGIEHVAFGIGNQTLVLVRGRGDTGHPLHDIEHCALDLQQTQLLAIHAERYIAGLDLIAIMQELLHPTFGVKVVDDLFRHLYTGDDTGVLDNKLLTAHLRRRNTTKRGMVAIANIFLKPEGNKFAQVLFFHDFTNFAAKLQKNLYISKFLCKFARFLGVDMKIAIFGYGKMGHMIERMALKRGHEIVCIIDVDMEQGSLADADVAIEFTTPATAEANVRRCWAAGLPVVSGTTGWNFAFDNEIAKVCTTPLNKQATRVSALPKNWKFSGAPNKRVITNEDGKIMFIWQSNFSEGVQMVMEFVAAAARDIYLKRLDYKTSISETHHIHKLDAPSGTAKTMAEEFARIAHIAQSDIPIESIREGEVPGIHTMTLDSDEDTIVITHIAKGREGFALGAIIAAEEIVESR